MTFTLDLVFDVQSLLCECYIIILYDYIVNHGNDEVQLCILATQVNGWLMNGPLPINQMNRKCYLLDSKSICLGWLGETLIEPCQENALCSVYHQLTALPVNAARCKGVSPIPFLALTSAPYCRKTNELHVELKQTHNNCTYMYACQLTLIY